MSHEMKLREEVGNNTLLSDDDIFIIGDADEVGKRFFKKSSLNAFLTRWDYRILMDFDEICIIFDGF